MSSALKFTAGVVGVVGLVLTGHVNFAIAVLVITTIVSTGTR